MTTYIASMPKLSHGEGTLDFIFLSVIQPFVMVSFCAQEQN